MLTFILSKFPRSNRLDIMNLSSAFQALENHKSKFQRLRFIYNSRNSLRDNKTYILIGIDGKGLRYFALLEKFEMNFSLIPISILIIAISGLSAIPVFGLTCFHIGLVAMGRTTNEQVTGKFGSGHNPFDSGCYRNCCSVLCGTHSPRYVGYKTPTFKEKTKEAMHRIPSRGPASAQDVALEMDSLGGENTTTQGWTDNQNFVKKHAANGTGQAGPSNYHGMTRVVGSYEVSV